MILLARTSAFDAAKKSAGMSIFLVETKSKGLDVRPIRNMVNHETNAVFIDNLEIPAENMIGEEGKGFRYILDGLNAERILIAAECIGDGYWFIDKSCSYAKDRVVFDRPIGQNQGIQFLIAEAYMEIEAANLMRYKASGCLTRKALRRRSEHGEAPRRQGFMGSGERACRRTAASASPPSTTSRGVPREPPVPWRRSPQI